MTHRKLYLAILSLLLLPGRAALAQPTEDPDTRTRQLWDDAFRKKRAEACRTPPAPAPATSTVPSPSPTPSKVATGAPTGSVAGDRLVGITVWRLRPLGAGEAGAVVWTTGTQDLTAERVEVGTVFAPGERVRLGIESGASGYLYLIDRERFADGSLGDPFLIFPRTRIRGGDNRVTAGRLVEVPDLADTPPFFTMKASRPDQTGDVITVLLTRTPLPDLPVGRDALQLERQTVERWERQWAAPVQRLELPRGAGTLYTPAEREAGRVTSRLLTQEEPVPQTLYRVEAKAGEPLLLTVPFGLRSDKSRE